MSGVPDKVALLPGFSFRWETQRRIRKDLADRRETPGPSCARHLSPVSFPRRSATPSVVSRDEERYMWVKRDS